MRVLITRPQRGAERLAEALMAHGHVPILAPLFTVAPLPVPADLEDRLRAAQAILLTSANGASALAAASGLRSRPVYAVGQATAATAEGLGFVMVFSADGNAEALADMVRRVLKPADGPLLNVGGTDVATDLGALLQPHGFVVDRIELYAAQAVTDLPDAASVALATQTVDVVTFLSPRAAATFSELVAKAGLRERLHPVAAVAISEAALAPVAALGWRHSVVARAPTQEAVVAAVEELLPGQERNGKEADMSDGAKPEPQAVTTPSTTVDDVSRPRPLSVDPPAPLPPARRGIGFAGAFVTGLVASALVLAAALAFAHARPELVQALLGVPGAPPSTDVAALVKARVDAAQLELRQSVDARVAAIEQRQDELRRNAGDLAARIAALPTAATGAEIASLRGAQAAALRDLQSLQAMIGQLQTQASALDNRLRQGSGTGGSSEELAALRQRLDKVETEAQGLTRAVGAASDSAGHAADRETVERELARQRTELDKQAQALRDQVQQVEQRAQAIDATLKQRLDQIAAARTEAEQRAGDSARAAAAIALSARLRQKVETGAAFAGDLDLLKPLAAQDARFNEVVGLLQPLAGGVPSLAALRLEFPVMAKAALAADLADDSLGERALGALKNLVSVRRVGADVQGDTVEARLARAEAALDAGDVAAAAALVKQLQGKPAEAASAWLKRAEAHVAAQAALDRLALLGVGLLAPKP